VPKDVVVGEELTVSLTFDSGPLAGELKNEYHIKVVAPEK
jgi:hypothetical protein